MFIGLTERGQLPSVVELGKMATLKVKYENLLVFSRLEVAGSDKGDNWYLGKEKRGPHLFQPQIPIFALDP